MSTEKEKIDAVNHAMRVVRQKLIESQTSIGYKIIRIAELEKALSRSREMLKLILYQNRSRGYPTGHEWATLVRESSLVLSEIEAIENKVDVTKPVDNDEE